MGDGDMKAAKDFSEKKTILKSKSMRDG